MRFGFQPILYTSERVRMVSRARRLLRCLGVRQRKCYQYVLLLFEPIGLFGFARHFGCDYAGPAFHFRRVSLAWPLASQGFVIFTSG
jgi:hypothetical protein